MDWTPRMQEVAETIARYALETGKLPTMTEVARRIGLSKERTRQIWLRIERWERTHQLADAEHTKRLHARYLLDVLKQIEKAAKWAALPEIRRDKIKRQEHEKLIYRAWEEARENDWEFSRWPRRWIRNDWPTTKLWQQELARRFEVADKIRRKALAADCIKHFRRNFPHQHR